MHLSVILIAVSALSLIAAYVSEHVFGLLPCVLCIYQRIPYFVIIGVCVLSMFVEGQKRAVLLAIAGITFWVGAGIAFFHVGVEQGVFVLEEGCVDSLSEIGSLEALRNAIVGKPAAPCDEPAFVFLGLSMAGWNFFFSFAWGLLTLNLTLRSWRAYRDSR
jgi:disulfide bond formation protein DsbB